MTHSTLPTLGEGKAPDMSVLWWVGIVAAAVFVVAGATTLWWWVPKWQMKSVTAGDPKACADIEDNFRKTVGQALGGIAVLIGAGMAYYGTQQTLQASDQQSQRNLEASRALLISQQVSKGFEDLGQSGSDKMVLRLGGIYALEGVMNGSEQYHQPVLEALCAFVREGTKTLTGEDRPATDIQAVLTVIGRRGPGNGDIDLKFAHVPRAILSEANLVNANLYNADLTEANFVPANLTDANLNDANLNHANLNDADLRDAQLNNADLRDATLQDADLRGADLEGSRLDGTDFRGARVTQSQLERACGATTPTLLRGLTLKPCSRGPP